MLCVGVFPLPKTLRWGITYLCRSINQVKNGYGNRSSPGAGRIPVRPAPVTCLTFVTPLLGRFEVTAGIGAAAGYIGVASTRLVRQFPRIPLRTQLAAVVELAAV